MKIVLQNSMIVVRTGFNILRSKWMDEFLSSHSQDMLFLPKAVLVFYNANLVETKEEFIQAMCAHYTT